MDNYLTELAKGRNMIIKHIVEMSTSYTYYDKAIKEYNSQLLAVDKLIAEAIGSIKTAH